MKKIFLASFVAGSLLFATACNSNQPTSDSNTTEDTLQETEEDLLNLIEAEEEESTTQQEDTLPKEETPENKEDVIEVEVKTLNQ